MPITQVQFRTLRERYAHRSSWALWREQRPGRNTADGIDDLTIFDEANNPWDNLNPQFIFVGLNPANDEATVERFSMFHSRRQGAQDYRLRYALRGTAFWGGYCTDVFPDTIERNCGRVLEDFNQQCQNDPDSAQCRLTAFLSELEAVERICELGHRPLLIAMGGSDDTHNVPQNTRDVLRWAENAGLLDGYEIQYIPHYSAPNYPSLDDYRCRVWNNLGIDGQQIVTQATPLGNATLTGEHPQNVALPVEDPQNAALPGERSQQYFAFWTRFKDWCDENNTACGRRAVHPDGMHYYDQSNITIGNDHLTLRFTIGDENGVPWVATEIYCREGEEQRLRISRHRNTFDAAFCDNSPIQDWDTPPPRAMTARVVRFSRPADWRNADDALFARMAADYDKIRKILRTIEE
jgi:hypothetical protein